MGFVERHPLLAMRMLLLKTGLLFNRREVAQITDAVPEVNRAAKLGTVIVRP